MVNVECRDGGPDGSRAWAGLGGWRSPGDTSPDEPRQNDEKEMGLPSSSAAQCRFSHIILPYPPARFTR